MYGKPVPSCSYDARTPGETFRMNDKIVAFRLFGKPERYVCRHKDCVGGLRSAQEIDRIVKVSEARWHRCSVCQMPLVTDQVFLLNGPQVA